MLVYSCQVYSIFIKCLLYNVVYNYCLECKVFVLILVYSPNILPICYYFTPHIPHENRLVNVQSVMFNV